MRHPRRYLRDYVDAEMTPERRRAVEGHLACCASCRAAVAEERRLRSRLRALRVPTAGPELSGRIAVAAARPAAEMPDPRGTASLDRNNHILAAGAALAAVAAVLLGGAYAAGALLEVPPDTGARTTMAGAWQEVSGSRPVALGPDQLASLRDRGWSCPELADLGLELDSARALQVQGQPAVEMVFTGEGEQIRLIEQHPMPGDEKQPVVNAFTGRPVAADGFKALGSDAGPAVFGSDEHPGQRVLAAGDVTYTFDSSLPVKSLPDAVEELFLLESARLARPGGGTEPMERLVHGLAVFTRNGWSL